MYIIFHYLSRLKIWLELKHELKGWCLQIFLRFSKLRLKESGPYNDMVQ